jgi:hypothetical protein
MKYLLIFAMFAMTACGYSARYSEMIGQVKKVARQTPIFCDDRVDADISLGVMRDGVGSMSSQDVWITVPNKEDQELLKRANESGELVKITYDDKRWTWCWHNQIVTKAELVK